MENIIGSHLLLPIKLNQEIKEVTSKFIDEDVRPKHIPLHITLGFAKINSKQFNTICASIRKLGIKRVFIGFKEIRNVVSSDRKTFYSQIVLRRTDRIQLLHEVIMDILNQSRNNGEVRNKDRIKFEKKLISKADFDHIQKYGYLQSFVKYSPHLTLGKYKNDSKTFNDTQKHYKDKLNHIIGRKYFTQDIEVVSELRESEQTTITRRIIKN